MPTISTSIKQTYIYMGLILLFFPTNLNANNSDQQLDSLQHIIDNQSKSGSELAQVYFQLAEIHANRSNYAIAIKEYEQAQLLAQQFDDQELVLTVLGAKAKAQGSKGERKASLQLLYDGLDIAKSQNIVEKEAYFLYLLGDYFRLQHDIPTAIEYLDKAKVLYESLGEVEKVCTWVLLSKASVYKVSKNREGKLKGIEIYEEILNGECASTFSEYGRAKLLNNLGSTYIFTRQLKKAERTLTKALALKRKLGNKTSLAFTLNEFASLREKESRFKEALEFGKEAYHLARQGENVFLISDILETLYVISRELKDYENGFNYQGMFYDILDSLKNVELTQSISELEVKYETAEKEKEIINTNLELSLQQNRSRNALFLSALLLLLASGIFFWYRTRLKRINEEALLLEKLNQSKSRYFTNISHELRTPLSLIIDPLQQLSASLNNSNQIALAKTASNNAQHMLHLVNQMLDLEKLEAGKMFLSTRKADLNQILKAIIGSFQNQAKQQNIDLQFVSESDYLDVYFDADKMEKVLFNLLGNAFKFTPEGGTISVLLLQKANHIEIIVKDTGPGIPKNKQAFIFDRFYQTDDTATRQFEGTGIGLSLCKELVQLHHGQLNVRSQLGIGSSFIVQLPLGRNHLKDHEIDETPLSTLEIKENIELTHIIGNTVIDKSLFPNDQQQAAEKQDKPILLLIEDNNDLRLYMDQQLRQEYQIIQASNGQAGLEMALDKIPDLIVCDIMMPIMDGYEVCKTLKNDGRTAHIPIILLSAKSKVEEKIQGLESKADDYLTKPFDSQELKIRIANLIELRQQLKLRYNKKQKLSPKDITVNSIDEAFLQQLLEVIETNLSDESFGVEELSKAIGMSRSQLYRKLKALTGQSTNLFLRNIRLQRALQLLQQASGSASEIAFQVGFSNPSYFFKCFKEEFNVTPGQVLKGEIIPESKKS